KAQFSEFDFDLKKLNQVDGKISYTLIDTIQNIPKDRLHSLLLEWVAVNFKSATNVIKLNDKEAGKIIVKGLSEEFYTFRVLGGDAVAKYYQHFTIDFTAKENRYRVIITDFELDKPATYSKYGGSPAIKGSIDGYYASIPKEYDWEKLKRPERLSINISKNVLKNTYSSSINTLQSIKDFIRKNANKTDKKDEF
ncbi:MAG: DUF4468 domain-containing protein, partial [Pedobacter sp.]